MLLYNAGIFTACSAFIENGYILIKDGKIIDVGPMDFCPNDEEKYDLSGHLFIHGSRDWTRTSNLEVNSFLLHH